MNLLVIWMVCGRVKLCMRGQNSMCVSDKKLMCESISK